MFSTKRWGIFNCRPEDITKHQIKTVVVPLLIQLLALGCLSPLLLLTIRHVNSATPTKIGFIPLLIFLVLFVVMFLFVESSKKAVGFLWKMNRKQRNDDFTIIQNGDLSVRVLLPDQKDALLALFKDQYEHLLKGRHKDVTPTTELGVSELLEAFEKGRLTGESLNFGVWHKSSLVGLVQVQRTEFADNEHYFCLSYSISEKFEGRGYITRAASVVCDIALSGRDVDFLVLMCEPTNTKSSELAKRLGFEYFESYEAALSDGNREMDMDLYLLS